MWLQMGAVLNIIVKHANDVHDELQQLSLETLSLFQCCVVRGKLQNISKTLIPTHLRHTFARYFMYCNILDSEITKCPQHSCWQVSVQAELMSLNWS